MDKLSVAIELAAKYHAGQVDKQGKPYILHCIRVMNNLVSLGIDPYMIVGILHDTLEDTQCTSREILHIFGNDVYEAIIALTRKENEPYFEYIDKLRQNEVARRVKLADLTDNLDRISSLREIDENKANSLEKRYRKAWDMILLIEE